MDKIRVAPAYDSKYLEIERPSPLIDKKIESLIQDVLHGRWDNDITDKVYSDFKTECHDFIFGSTLNKLSGIEHFKNINIINGCTQFIDNLYMNSNSPQTIVGDYRYHQRLGRCIYYVESGKLVSNLPLIIAMPFPSTGNKHENMESILDEALEKNIKVHIDGAWITTCRDIEFNFNHPAIDSIGISLSKGCGLGWNRIGLRYTRQQVTDSVTIMNDFHMNNRALAKIGLHFIRNLESDHLWTNHGDKYYKVCNDFDLTPTKSVYLALRDNHPVGVSPLIRYLENE